MTTADRVLRAATRHPFRLPYHPLYRFYEGGSQTRAFRGLPNRPDDWWSEDWVGSCTVANNAGPNGDQAGVCGNATCQEYNPADGGTYTYACTLCLPADGGNAGSGGSGGGASGGAAGASAADAGTKSSGSGGGGCSVTGSRAALPGALLLLGLVGLFGRRRRP